MRKRKLKNIQKKKKKTSLYQAISKCTKKKRNEIKTKMKPEKIASASELQSLHMCLEQGRRKHERASSDHENCCGTCTNRVDKLSRSVVCWKYIYAQLEI